MDFQPYHFRTWLQFVPLKKLSFSIWNQSFIVRNILCKYTTQSRAHQYILIFHFIFLCRLCTIFFRFSQRWFLIIVVKPCAWFMCNTMLCNYEEKSLLPVDDLKLLQTIEELPKKKQNMSPNLNVTIATTMTDTGVQSLL